MDDIDPAAYAGEGFSAEDEIPVPADIDNPYLRGRVKREGDYWPGPDRRHR